MLLLNIYYLIYIYEHMGITNLDCVVKDFFFPLWHSEKTAWDEQNYKSPIFLSCTTYQYLSSICILWDSVANPRKRWKIAKELGRWLHLCVFSTKWNFCYWEEWVVGTLLFAHGYSVSPQPVTSMRVLVNCQILRLTKAIMKEKKERL